MNKGFGNLKADKVIEKNDNSVNLTFAIPQDSLYFDGHFPGYPVLPAVAQIDIVVNFASQYLGTGISISRIKRTKFTKIITPSLTLLLKLEKKDNVIDFKITAPNEKEIYSSGSIVMEDEHERKTK